jgi:hypothetical protein
VGGSVGLMLLLALWVGVLAGHGQTDGTQPRFRGTYEELRPAQKQLIDEWYADYNRMTNDHSEPTEYNQFSLSTRTTYEAVTHALMTTNLTDKSGKPMGTALDLVQGIEAINGKVPRARGDLQFRMYVLLKPDALKKLKDSSEFFRDRDNTIYHRGFPLNYRQDGTPSIQVSMAKDGRHADIDVDYRSSKFPVGLFNGHLTEANSDVRAGNNMQVHLQRWQGLTDWWRSLFGVPGVADDPKADLAPGDVPPIPRKAEGKLEDAVQDFLQAWLVEQKPELSASYFSARSFACLEEYGAYARDEINTGVAPYVAARGLSAASRAVGKVTSLQGAVEPANLVERDIKPIRQPYLATFSLYRVPNGEAADFECDSAKAYEDFDSSRVSGTAGKYGQYFAAVFRLKSAGRKSDVITLLWTKEDKYWRVAAWQIEPEESKPGVIPDTRRRNPVVASAPAKTPVRADPAMLEAAHDFLHTWLVDDNFDRAATYVSPRCNECVNLYLAEGEKPPATTEEYSVYIRKALGAVDKDLGKVQHLHDALEPVRPEHEDLQVVEHAGEHAYTLVAVPDYLVGAFLCDKRSSKNPYVVADESGRQKNYGDYYAVLFTLRAPGDHPAALTLLWAKENGKWKIIAYEVMTP